MSISSLSSLASTAFDTARSTIKALGEAAVPPGSPDGDKKAGGDKKAEKHKALAMKSAETRTPAEKTQEPDANPRNRRGNKLDSYA